MWSKANACDEQISWDYLNVQIGNPWWYLCAKDNFFFLLLNCCFFMTKHLVPLSQYKLCYQLGSVSLSRNGKNLPIGRFQMSTLSIVYLGFHSKFKFKWAFFSLSIIRCKTAILVFHWGFLMGGFTHLWLPIHNIYDGWLHWNYIASS